MHPSARALTTLSSLALFSTAVRGAARGHAEPGEPVPGCLGCEAATMASTSGAAMCEPHRAFFASAAAAREALRTQPQPPTGAEVLPTAPRGPNRAQRRAAMFRSRRAR